ncbi:6-phosphogluconolactonase [Methylobacterium sp. J-090]|uniref:6-phosphogluconolactonase n=1 Tax=Methylobacterium sp. J-090 TaxID=2836666 RepID=UPI001FBB3BF4|nr:6-phosphogluconolactonase [Methylobacterium sp. J-090]MCJ2080899.1 6-phosphogluconolactonase [Methylobacterium sp. J-090]
MIPLPGNSEILPDAESVARAAADRLVALCAAAPDRPIAICLSGGSTPKRLYALLAGPDYRDALPWARLHWFFGDDRHVPWDDAASNVRMAREAFAAAPIPVENLHGIPTDGTLEADAAAYAKALKDFYGADRLDPDRPLFDLVLLGLGEDGHTASLFPGKPALDETTAWVAPAPEAGLAPFVPRITLTFPALASARSILFLATGEAKRVPLERRAGGEALPAFHVTGPVTWLVDRAAAGL